MAGRDKLATPVAGRPLLAWTLERLAAAPGVERIVVVTAPSGSPTSLLPAGCRTRSSR